LEKQPGVIAVYHFIRSDLGDDMTIIIWDSPEAMKQYRESSIIQEAMAIENALGRLLNGRLTRSFIQHLRGSENISRFPAMFNV
jgi:hypothetical protein